MREFFKGWRRKVGCVTLVMASALAGMWSRSFVVWDQLSTAPTPDHVLEFNSDRGRLGIQYHSLFEHEVGFEHSEWLSDTYAPDFSLFAYLLNRYQPEDFKWRSDFWGASIGVYTFRDAFFCVTPYWSLILPLTLLSAYLILWKPRPKVERDA